MKQSYKQSFALLCITLLASQSVFGIMTNPSRVAGVHPKHRRLSQMGMLDLSIDGRGYFAFALRVKAPGADAASDESMATPGSADYDSAYGTGAPGPANTASSSGMQVDGGEDGLCRYTEPTADDAATCLNSAGGAGAGTECSVTAIANTGKESPAVGVICPVTSSADKCTAQEISDQKDACNAASSDLAATGAENNDGAEGVEHYLQVVYSRDGSLHINRYGFLVDDNGLLLLGRAAKTNTDPTEEDATTLAKEAIHIPSRTDEIIVTTTGKVISKTDGAVFTQVGQLKLTRFANPMGLNVRLNMRSRCSSMNEIGFSLGNWCAGTPLDGKAHEYLVETEVSGAGEVANPGDSGYGNIVQ